MLQITLRDKDRRTQHTVRTLGPGRKDTDVGGEEYLSPDLTRDVPGSWNPRTFI